MGRLPLVVVTVQGAPEVGKYLVGRVFTVWLLAGRHYLWDIAHPCPSFYQGKTAPGGGIGSRSPPVAPMIGSVVALGPAGESGAEGEAELRPVSWPQEAGVRQRARSRRCRGGIRTRGTLATLKKAAPGDLEGAALGG